MWLEEKASVITNEKKSINKIRWCMTSASFPEALEWVIVAIQNGSKLNVVVRLLPRNRYNSAYKTQSSVIPQLYHTFQVVSPTSEKRAWDFDVPLHYLVKFACILLLPIWIQITDIYDIKKNTKMTVYLIWKKRCFKLYQSGHVDYWTSAINHDKWTLEEKTVNRNKFSFVTWKEWDYLRRCWWRRDNAFVFTSSSDHRGYYFLGVTV